jgi:signal peptidase II
MTEPDRVNFSWKLVLTPLHVWTTLIVFILDQVTKYWVLYEIDHGAERIPIWEPLLSFIHVKNPGAAFGLFADLSLMGRILIFGTVTIICVWLLIYWMGTTPKALKWQRFAFALILGGAIGNLKDRIFFQQVTDFIAVRIPFDWISWIHPRFPNFYDWPTFNVADMGISVGVSIVILALIVESFKQKSFKRS